MALRVVALLLLASAARLQLASACILAWNGNQACNSTNCGKLLGQVDTADSTVSIGSTLGGPGGLNYRFFATLVMGDTTGSNATYPGWYVLDQKPAPYVTDCCKLCREASCAMFRHFPKNTDDLPLDPASRALTQQVNSPTSTPPAGGWPVVYPPPYPPKPLSLYKNFDNYDPSGAKGNCVLFGMSSPVHGLSTSSPLTSVTTCTAGTKNCFNQPQSKNGAGAVFGVNAATGLISDLTLSGAVKEGITGKPRSYWGGMCNWDPIVTGDPHFVGADGVRFEFNGVVDKTFCLITDTNIHVNMLIGGYVDKRQIGPATSKAGSLRSWITGLSFLWKDEAGKKHSLFVMARKSADAARGDGFLSLVSVDGEELPLPKVGDTIERNGMALTFVGEGKYGNTDMDKYEVRIGGLLAGRLNVRSAHPLLRTKTDAYAHFDFKLEELATTSKIHGVLGQTYRNDAARAVRVLEYKLLSTLLHGPMHADGENGLGYLDGKVDDYATSSATEPDCKFATAFNAM